MNVEKLRPGSSLLDHLGVGKLCPIEEIRSQNWQAHMSIPHGVEASRPSATEAEGRKCKCIRSCQSGRRGGAGNQLDAVAIEVTDRAKAAP